MKAWVRLWDHQEAPWVLALVRILLATVMLADLLPLWPLGLIEPTYAPAPLGLGHLETREREHLLYSVLDPSAATTLYAVTCLALASFGAGFFTRISGLVALFLYAQLALVLPLADRGIDLAFRNVILLLVLANAGRALSIDAWRRTGSWIGDELAPAWGRHLLILQLTVIYFLAGVQKVGLAWWPAGDWSAIWIVLQDPAIARFAPDVVPWRLTQLATLSTMLFEWGAVLFPLAYWLRSRGKRAGTWIRNGLVVFGAGLHVGIAVTMTIGIFPYGMLALYPAFFHPDELKAAWARLRGARRL